jgi:hypothetical protein
MQSEWKKGGQIRSLLLLILWGMVSGCVDSASRYGASPNRGQDAMEVARAEAVINYSCPKMQADPQVGKVREGDAEGGLFSEYLVRVRGCGENAVYRVSCRKGGLCAVEE